MAFDRQIHRATDRPALPMASEERIAALQEIYDRYEAEAAVYKQGAVCRPGCAFCCTEVGNVDITTLEGLVIRERIGRMPKTMQKKIAKDLVRNRRLKKVRAIVRCPFLTPKNLCLIYEIRPFSCRRLYSVKPCEGRGPTIHRQTQEMTERAVARLQRLDDCGYSGHISFILTLLDSDDFRSFYTAGGFDPRRIAGFGKANCLVINRIAGGGPT